MFSSPLHQITSFAWQFVYVRYLLASAVSLTVDLICFLLLLWLLDLPVAAAVGGYLAGLCLHWLISSRMVFKSILLEVDRVKCKRLFAASALAGLSITTTIIATGEAINLDPLWGKAIAILTSFQAIYLVRKFYVFR